jgi:hypothetical protein
MSDFLIILQGRILYRAANYTEFTRVFIYLTSLLSNACYLNFPCAHCIPVRLISLHSRIFFG